MRCGLPGTGENWTTAVWRCWPYLDLEYQKRESRQVLETLWKPLDTEKTQCGAPLYQTVRQCESCHAILRNFSSDG